MTVTELRDCIKAVPFIRTLPGAIGERFGMILWWISSHRRVEPGELLYEEGDERPGGGCLMLEGRAEVNRKGEEPEEVVAPDLLGEIQQFRQDHRRTATVRVTQEAHVLEFSWSDAARLVTEYMTEDEQEILRRFILQTAWARCTELFDEAARQAR